MKLWEESAELRKFYYPNREAMGAESPRGMIGQTGNRPGGSITDSYKRTESNMSDTLSEERMLKWFVYDHLPAPLKSVSAPFHHLAHLICGGIVEPGPERTVALRKLLEAKDAAVRATLHPGG